MTKADDIEKRWASTVKFLLATDIVFIFIISYIVYNRIIGDPNAPSFATIAFIIVIIIIGNIVLYFFMKLIKNTVKGIVDKK
jgi:hypothetical protein